jgi:citrate synthase
MSILKQRVEAQIPAYRERVKRLVKEYGDTVVDQVKIAQFYGGMRGVKCLTTDISYLDPVEGIRFRGYTIPEAMAALPKPTGAEMPFVEGHFFLLMTGAIPTADEIAAVNAEFSSRSKVPDYVFDILNAMPQDTHPMTMFSAAVMALQRESEFAKAYREGINRDDYWDPVYEDVINLIAKLPEIAAYIYRYKYRNGNIISPDENLDLGANFAHMMGIPAPYDDVARMYFIIHSDHESGNVSAHTTHLVASALSDPYYAFSAGLNGLSGPLHGLANQEVLRWIQNLSEQVGDNPSKEQLEKYVRDTLDGGQVIPGYGHAVLRRTDPRYTAQREFALKHMPDDTLFKVVSNLYDIVPPILDEYGKAKNPWPNVDAHSGVIQWHYGVREYDYYTVMFGVGRALGVLANIVWDRIAGQAIERPKSLTTAMLEEKAGIK